MAINKISFRFKTLRFPIYCISGLLNRPFGTNTQKHRKTTGRTVGKVSQPETEAAAAAGQVKEWRDCVLCPKLLLF